MAISADSWSLGKESFQDSDGSSLLGFSSSGLSAQYMYFEASQTYHLEKIGQKVLHPDFSEVKNICYNLNVVGPRTTEVLYSLSVILQGLSKPTWNISA